MNDSSTIRNLIAQAGAHLARETRNHPHGCDCERCSDLFALSMSVGSEAISAELRESFPAVPVVSDLGKANCEDALLTLAINVVIEKYDSADFRDVSEQVVSLIMEDEIFEPLRERIYANLFDS